MMAMKLNKPIYKFLISDYPANDIRINSFEVERYKIKKLSKTSYEIFIDGGNGVYCTKIKLFISYLEEDSDPFILLSPLKEKRILGQKMKFADPWFEYENYCD